jgi:hypothetical protein
MSYTFKTAEELGWAALVAVVVFIGTQITAVDPAGITDWKAWTLALLAGAARAAFAAVVAKFGAKP